MATRIGISVLIASFSIFCALSLRDQLARLPVAELLRSWKVVLLVSSLSLLNYVLRVMRWRSYLRRFGHMHAFLFSMLAYLSGFAFTLSPGRLGELARARYYKGVGVSHEHVIASYVIERLMDVLAMALLASLILNTAPRYNGFIWIAAIVTLCSLATLMVVPWGRLLIYVRSPDTATKSAAGLTCRVLIALSSARTLLTPSVAILGFCIGLAAWSLEGTGLAVLSASVSGIHIPIPTAIGIYAVSLVSGTLSFLPGGVGSTEAIMVVLLRSCGDSLREALIVTVLFRLLTFWTAICLGWLSVFALRRRVRSIEEHAF